MTKKVPSGGEDFRILKDKIDLENVETGLKNDDKGVSEDGVYEIDLVDLLLTLWKRKLIILATIFIFAACAIGYVVLKPRMYESRVTLTFLPPPPVPKGQTAPQRVSLTPDTYLELATADDMLDDVIKAMSKGSSGKKEIVSMNALRNGLRVKFVEAADKARKGKNPDAMIASFRSKNSKIVKQVLDTWSKLFIQKTAQFSTDRSATSLESLSRSVEKAKKDLEKAEDKLLACQKENPVSMMQIQLKAKGETYSKLLSQYDTKSTALAPLEKEAEVAAILLEKQPETKILTRGMSNEALWNVVTQSSGRLSKFDPKQFNVSNEVENPLYRKLQEESVNAEIKVESNRVAIKDLAERIEKAQKEYSDLNAKILSAKTKIERLSREKSALQKTYNSLLDQYQRLRATSENTSDTLKVIEKPVNPRRPVSRGGRKILCLASLLGLFVGTTLALLTELIARRKKTV